MKHISKNNIKKYIDKKTLVLFSPCLIPITETLYQIISQEPTELIKNGILLGSYATFGYVVGKFIGNQKNEIYSNFVKNHEETILNFERLIQNIPGIGFFMLDENGKYTRVNSNFAQMINMQPESIVGKTNVDIFPLLPDEIVQDLLGENIEALNNENEGERIIERIVYLPTNRKEHVLMIKKIPFIDNGQNLMMGVAVDIADLIEKQKFLEKEMEFEKSNAENAKEKEKLRKAFLANMSHEIRTPLNAIIGFSALTKNLSEDEDTNMDLAYIKKKSKYYSNIISKQGYQLLGLIENLLDISKMDAGEEKVSEMNFSIKDLINDIAVAQNHSIAKKNKDIPIKVDNKSLEKIPDEIWSDESKVAQILNNLIGNAIKFTENGEINIFCQKVEDLGDEIKIHISVKDTGKGISPEEVHKVFQRFVQIDDVNVGKGGTGLGLPLAKGFCNLMGGDISLESKKLVGSTFTFSFVARIISKNKKVDSSLELKNNN